MEKQIKGCLFFPATTGVMFCCFSLNIQRSSTISTKSWKLSILFFSFWISQYDRCLSLEIQWDIWLNRIRTNQCNHAGVRGKWGQQHTVCLLARRSFWQVFCAPGLLLHAWSGRLLTSTTLPWGPHRCLTKSTGRSAAQTCDGGCDECLSFLAA